MKETWKISSHPPFSPIPIRELWQYRYLLQQLIKKELSLYHRQTFLGPLWFFIQPALSTLVYTFVFAQLARISTDEVPPILFYLAGLSVWNYFSECFSKTCTLLRDHSAIFNKLYFPRLIIPLSIVISNLVKFGIQLLLFGGVYSVYIITGSPLNITGALLLVPFLILLMAFLGLGMGLLVSALTVRYRDLAFLVSFGTQLLLFVTPVIYPLSSIPPAMKWVIQLNPITSVIETFRYAFLGVGASDLYHLGYSSILICSILFCGLALYHKTEKNFIDLI